MARYLVTGGAGFTGINFIRFLLAKGESVRSLDIAPFDYPERGRIDVVTGDIRDKNTVDEAMNGVDMVIHAAMALPLYPKKDILTTGIDGTRNILEAALRHGVSRVIHISSTAVYGIPDHHPLLETDKLEGVGPYGEAKIAAENIFRDLTEKPKIKYRCKTYPFAIPIGGKYAICKFGSLTISGFPGWIFKQLIELYYLFSITDNWVAFWRWARGVGIFVKND